MGSLPAYRFRVDLHVHTRRYSPCAELLDPTRLAQALRRQGLHGAVLTEHDQVWPEEELAALNRRSGRVRLYRGVEVSSRNGHFVVIGLQNLEGIQPGIGIAELIAKAVGQNAAVICVHPHLSYAQTREPLNLEDLPRGIHAVEVVSTLTRQAHSTNARRMAERAGWSMVGGSDAHSLPQVGQSFTQFPELPRNERHLAEMIRAGRCMPGQREESEHEESGCC